MRRMLKFIDFVKTCAETVIYENPADVEALLAAKAHGSDMTVDAMLKDKILTIGENIKIRRFVRYEGDCVAYVHGGGRIGVSFVLRPRTFRQKFSTSAARTSQCRLPL